VSLQVDGCGEPQRLHREGRLELHGDRDLERPVGVPATARRSPAVSMSGSETLAVAVTSTSSGVVSAAATPITSPLIVR
jgi:hypothetical protein